MERIRPATEPWAASDVILGVIGTESSPNVKAIHEFIGQTICIDQNSSSNLQSRTYTRYIIVQLAFKWPYLVLVCGKNAFRHKVNTGEFNPYDSMEPNNPMAIRQLRYSVEGHTTPPILHYDQVKTKFYVTIGYHRATAWTIYLTRYVEPPPLPPSSPWRKGIRKLVSFAVGQAIHPDILHTINRYLALDTV